MQARKGDNFTGGRRYHHLTSLQHRNFDCIIPAAAIGTPPLWPAGGRQTSSASVAVPAACPTLLGQATAAAQHGATVVKLRAMVSHLAYLLVPHWSPFLSVAENLFRVKVTVLI